MVPRRRLRDSDIRRWARGPTPRFADHMPTSLAPNIGTTKELNFTLSLNANEVFPNLQSMRHLKASKASLTPKMCPKTMLFLSLMKRVGRCGRPIGGLANWVPLLPLLLGGQRDKASCCDERLRVHLHF
jgi:hypothetical protein